MGWDKVRELCEERLDPKHIKERKGSGNVKLKYVEGWHAIDEANRIFGYGAWSRHTTLIPLGEPYAQNNKWHVHVAATVRITVDLGDHGSVVFRDGCGFGSGINSNRGDAYEIAVKTAETDATKRALVTFGKPFGLELYDKDYSVSSVEEGEGRGVGSLPPSDDDRQGLPSRTNSSSMAPNGMSASRSKGNYTILEEDLRKQSTPQKIITWFFANAEGLAMLEERQYWQFFDMMMCLGVNKCTTVKGVGTFWNTFQTQMNRYEKFNREDHDGLRDVMLERETKLKAAAAFNIPEKEIEVTIQDRTDLTPLDAG